MVLSSGETRASVGDLAGSLAVGPKVRLSHGITSNQLSTSSTTVSMPGLSGKAVARALVDDFSLSRSSQSPAPLSLSQESPISRRHDSHSSSTSSSSSGIGLQPEQPPLLPVGSSLPPIVCVVSRLNSAPSDSTLDIEMSIPSSQPDEDLIQGAAPLDSSFMHTEPESDGAKLRALKGWVNSLALLLPNPKQLHCSVRKDWDRGVIGGLPRQRDDVFSRLTKFLGKPLSAFACSDARILRKSESRGVAFVLFFETTEGCRVFQAELNQHNVTHQPFNPFMLTVEAVWPVDETDSEIARCVAQAAIPGFQYFKRVHSVVVSRGTAQFVIPQESLLRLQGVRTARGLPLRWFEAEKTKTRCCPKCIETGHTAAQCKKPRRCFRCTGACVEECTSASPLCGFCGGDHIGVHCKRFYVRRRIPIMFPQQPRPAAPQRPARQSASQLSALPRSSFPVASSSHDASETDLKARVLALEKLVTALLAVLGEQLAAYPTAQQAVDQYSKVVSSAPAVSSSAPASSSVAFRTANMFDCLDDAEANDGAEPMVDAGTHEPMVVSHEPMVAAHGSAVARGPATYSAVVQSAPPVLRATAPLPALSVALPVPLRTQMADRLRGAPASVDSVASVASVALLLLLLLLLLLCLPLCLLLLLLLPLRVLLLLRLLCLPLRLLLLLLLLLLLCLLSLLLLPECLRRCQMA